LILGHILCQAILLSENGCFLDVRLKPSKIQISLLFCVQQSRAPIYEKKVLFTIIGYSRVSTQDQKPDFQMDALEKARDEQIF